MHLWSKGERREEERRVGDTKLFWCKSADRGAGEKH